LIEGIDLLLILPEVILAVLGIVILGVDLFYLRRKKRDGVARSNWLGYFTLLGLLVISLSSWVWGARSPLYEWFGLFPRLFAALTDRMQMGGQVFGGVFQMDGITQLFRVVFLLVAAFVLLLSRDRKWGEHEGEYYALLIFAVLGMTLMAGAVELITVYVALELTSIALYILASLDFRRRSIEAGLKYFLFGAFSSALLIYGLSLVYGFTGTTRLDGIKSAIALASGGTLEGLLQPANSGLLLGIVFLVAGFGFKLALVPFHAWTPDVYEGAPTPITAFISTGSKAASFIVFLRVMLQALPGAAELDQGKMGGWAGLLAVLAVVTFTVGNLMALPQKNVKRLLAYSSIAHAGYMLIGILLMLNSRAGTQALFYYLAAYVLTNVGAFTTVIAVSRAVGGEELQHFAGLSKRNLLLAGALSVLFLSLGGLPPLAGFIAKFWLFFATWEQGLYWLVVVALLNTLISFFYYLRVLKAVWFEKPADDKPAPISDEVSVVLLVTTGLIILIGVIPNLAFRFLESAVSVFFPFF